MKKATGDQDNIPPVDLPIYEWMRRVREYSREERKRKRERARELEKVKERKRKRKREPEAKEG